MFYFSDETGYLQLYTMVNAVETELTEHKMPSQSIPTDDRSTAKQEKNQGDTTDLHWWFYIRCIIIDILNLAEQIGMYFAQRRLGMDDATQRKFFFILFGIEGGNAFKLLGKNELFRTIVSILIEIGELLCYLLILERTSAVIAVSVLFFVFQIIMHVANINCIIDMYNKKKEKEKQSTQKRYEPQKPKTQVTCPQVDICSTSCCKIVRKKIRSVIYYVIMLAMINIGPILTIFLNNGSQFRQTIYEIPLTISLFIATTCSEFFKHAAIFVKDWCKQCCSNSDKKSIVPNFLQYMKKKSKIEKYWIYLNYGFATIDVVLMSILSLTLVGLEWIRKTDSWSSYERRAYLVIILISITFLLLSPVIIVSLCCAGSVLTCQKTKNLKSSNTQKEPGQTQNTL